MDWAQPLFQIINSKDDAVENMVHGQNTDYTGMMIRVQIPRTHRKPDTVVHDTVVNS